MRVATVVNILGVILGILVVALPANGDDSTGPISRGKGAFHADCAFDHSLSDDPIVFPRGPGASHLHDFFGSRTLNAFSTNGKIRQAAGTCVRTDTPARDSDRSAYWAPALYVAGTPITPVSLGAYYTSGFRRYKAIEPFPANLRMIAGDSKGGTPQDVNGQIVYLFECEGGTLLPGSANVAPTCKTPLLTLSIRFPDCWDGVHSDSPNHKQHMAYSRQQNRGWACPPGYPVLVPKLQIRVRYPTTGGPTTALASGGINTAHADFMNGWNTKKLAALVHRCLNTDKYCGGSERPVPGHT
jgi:hypothetical protein